MTSTGTSQPITVIGNDTNWTDIICDCGRHYHIIRKEVESLRWIQPNLNNIPESGERVRTCGVAVSPMIKVTVVDYCGTAPNLKPVGYHGWDNYQYYKTKNWVYLATTTS